MDHDHDSGGWLRKLQLTRVALLLVVAGILIAAYVMSRDRCIDERCVEGGGEYALSGVVIENDRSQVPADGPGFVRVKLQSGNEATVTYSCGMIPVANAEAGSVGSSLVPGDTIEAFGKILGGMERAISVCEDERYYLRKKDPSPQAGQAPESGRVTPEYYANIEARCAGRSGDGQDLSCCERSVDEMRQGGYMLASDGNSCPSGYVKNQLLCAASFAWCEPDTQN